MTSGRVSRDNVFQEILDREGAGFETGDFAEENFVGGGYRSKSLLSLHVLADRCYPWALRARRLP